MSNMCARIKDALTIRITQMYKVFAFFIVIVVNTGRAIDCYKCVSTNGNNEACEDVFKRDLSTLHLIARDCQYGYFSGTHCVKLKGVREDGTKILVRHCSDSDWGKTCGDIRYIYDINSEERIQGCLTSCNYDGCNTSSNRQGLRFLIVIMIILLRLSKLIFRMS